MSRPGPVIGPATVSVLSATTSIVPPSGVAVVPPTLTVIPRLAGIVKVSVARTRPLVVAPASVRAAGWSVPDTAPRFASDETSSMPPPQLVIPAEIVLLPESTSVPLLVLIKPPVPLRGPARVTVAPLLVLRVPPAAPMVNPRVAGKSVLAVTFSTPAAVAVPSRTLVGDTTPGSAPSRRSESIVSVPLVVVVMPPTMAMSLPMIVPPL